jgi:sugar O-acyltransferase (sialic acid O-acetyltransferase NeuD family)
MSALLVLGAGGHGKVVADAALGMAQWDYIAFADDARYGSAGPLELDIVGRLSEFEELRSRFRSVALGIGDNKLRDAIFRRASAAGYDLPLIVHPSASVSKFATLGPGCVVFAQAAINAGASLGHACIVNTGATVDHDCEIAEAVHVSPGAHLAGGVKIGAGAWIGIGASVREGVRIGAGAKVGAGSVVVKEVTANSVVYGVPAKVRT